DFLLRECERSYPFKYLSIVRRSTFKSRANWLLLIFILELSISKFNFGKSSSPLISISVLISICICIIFTPKILCITNHLLYILIQSFMYIVRVSFIQKINFNSVSEKANVSKSWLYKKKDIRNRIETLRGMQISELIPRKQSKSPRSEEVLIRTLKSRIKALEDENKQLKDQVQKLYGKLF